MGVYKVFQGFQVMNFNLYKRYRYIEKPGVIEK